MSQQGQLSTSGSGGAVVEFLTGNSGGPVPPDAAFNINVVGNNPTGINVVGMPGSSTLTIVGIQATTSQRGTVQLATNAQSIAGTDTSLVITPSTLTAKLGAQTLNGLPIGAGTTSPLTWTSAPTNGQILIGNTAGTPSLGKITSTGGTITVTNGPGTINLDLTGGGVAIETINGDSGSITGNSVTIFSNTATQNSGCTVNFTNSGTTSTFNVTNSTTFDTLIGLEAGNAGLSGVSQDFNTGVGWRTMRALTTASQNSAFGVQSLNTLTSGDFNSAFGTNTGRLLATGTNNCFLGYLSGESYTGAESSNLLINNVGTLGESNVIRIGTQGSGTGQQNLCFVAGITGVTVSNPAIVTLNTSTGQLGTTTGLPGIVTWTAIGANQTLAVGNGYFCTTGGALSLALPGTSAVGDTIRVVLDGSTSWTITQPNAATRIRIGSSQTTLGVTGTLASTSVGDSIELVCETANARWSVVSMIGNITVV